MSNTVFDKIISGQIKSYKVWENKSHLAFLTPFPNTYGVTIVIPKINIGDYIFNIDSEEYKSLLNASKIVAKILEKAFKTTRVAMVVEGTGIPYVHIKLYPLLGDIYNKNNTWKKHIEFNTEYPGFLTTAEGPLMNNEELKAIQKKIISAQKKEN